MNYDTLVLNKLYIPLHIVKWKRSMSLLYQDAARSLDKDFVVYHWGDWVELSRTLNGSSEYRMVKTSKYKVAVPDIIVLSEYAKIPRRDIKFSRENVFHRDQNRCQYCGRKFKKSVLTIDHVIPKSRGGQNSWDNIVAACQNCNSIKADRTPSQAGMKLISKPGEPKWYSALAKSADTPNLRPNWSKFLNSIGIE